MVPRSYIALLLVPLALGCPESSPVQQSDGGQDMPAATDAGVDEGADTSETVTAIELTVEPVDVGLFDGPPPVDPIEVALVRDGDALRWTTEFDWPAGVTRYALAIDGETPPTEDEQLAGLSVFADESPTDVTHTVFVPTTTRVQLTVSSVEGELVHRVERVDDTQAGLPADAPGHLDAAGAWFDDVWRVWGSDDPGAVVVELMDAIRTRGGALKTDDGFLFIAAAQEGESAPQIRGSWNDWAADPASELVRIAPGFRARYIDVGPGRHEYKIYYPDGDAWVTDRANRHVAWDGIDTGTVGNFNSVLRPEAGSARLVWFPEFYSPQLDNGRDVWVQVPAGYDDADGAYPTLYVHDGNESISRGQFHGIARATAAADPATAALLVFVGLPTQDVRLSEYTMATADSRGDEYAAFIADTLVEFVDGRFRASVERKTRGVAGASLGGLISYWIAMQHPEQFGYAAGMSSSFFWEDEHVIGRIDDLGCQDTSFYLDSGSPNDNYEVTLTMRDTLDGLGCDYRYVLDDGAQHDWSFWNARFDGVLRHFAESHGD